VEKIRYGIKIWLCAGAMFFAENNELNFYFQQVNFLWVALNYQAI
jgi:hypothetical protein